MPFPYANTAFVLAKRPTADAIIEGEHLVLTNSEISSIQDGEILVRVLALSIDPTQRVWATDAPQYMPPSPLNAPMRAGGVAVVEESKNDAWKVGTAVTGLFGAQKYAVLGADAAKGLNPVDLKALPVSAYLAIFSHIGLTAYHGLFKICKPKAGETVVVTGAAGATGSLVVQFAKLSGARVVAIAGSDEKTEWLKSLGADAVINYKTQDVREQLATAAPSGVDCLFENVGGDIMDAVLERMNNYGRVAVCGLISTYMDSVASGPKKFAMVIHRRLTLQGFICFDHMDEFPELIAFSTPHLQSGKLTYRTTEVVGIENFVKAINGLFTGANVGKTYVTVSQL